MTSNSKQTSAKIASLASETLKDKSASQVAKQLAASALSQAGTSKQTGSTMEDLASKVIQSPKYNQDTKSLAGAVLSQSVKER